jgi:hypothetical protein
VANILSTVLTRYKADPSDHKAKLKGLRGEEKKRHQELLKEMDAQNAKIDKQIAFWGKVAVGVGGAVAAFKLAKTSFNSYVQNTQLAAATANLSIDRLSTSTRGLVEQTDLMREASKLQSGAWKFNQEQMELVLRATDVMRRKLGQEFTPTLQKVTESLSKGTTEELKKFGITAKTQTEVIAQMREMVRGFNLDTDAAGDSMKRAGVSAADSFDRMKTAIGRMVVAMAPLLDRMAKFIEALSIVVDRISGAPQRDPGREAIAAPDGASPELRALIARLNEGRAAGAGQSPEAQRLLREIRAQALKDKQERQRIQGEVAFLTTQQDALDAFIRGLGEKVKKRASARAPTLGAVEDPMLAALFSAGQGLRRGAGAVPGLFASGLESARMLGRTTLAGDPQFGALGQAQQDVNAFHLQEGSEALKQLEADIRAFDAAKQQAIGDRNHLLESIFGRPAEVDATAMAIQGAARAMDVFAQSTALAFEAWVTGAEGGMEAAKKFLAAGIHGIGQELAVIGVKEGALALVSLAGLDFRGAATHGLASGAAFAGSALAFKTAQSMGHGGGNRPSAGASGSAPRVYNGSGAGAGAGQGERSVVVALGSEFGMLPALEQRQMLGRAIRLGLHEQGSPHTFDR